MKLGRNACIILLSSTRVGTHPACTSYEIAVNKLHDCDYFEKNWELSHDDFIGWNPSVKPDCSGIQVGHSYCVRIDHRRHTPTTTPAPQLEAHLSSTTPGRLLPTLTQIGVTRNCKTYHQAVPGDTCSKIASKYKLSDLAQFVRWNPAVGADCSGLKTYYHYCVGKITTAIPPNCIRVHPTPTQPGSICKCKSWHQVVSDDTCANIEARYKITAAQFMKWNPLIGPQCKLLWEGYNVCVGV
ncbi:carbohydrate-binding module family 50 protein [Daldinia sp. FL1419]|nr:carbohydrate-binding module family 50 protein [Daldinia sp. FL1419]